MFGQCIVNFIVPGNGLFLTSGGIEIDVMPSATPQEDTNMPKQLTNEFVTLQIVISFVW